GRSTATSQFSFALRRLLLQRLRLAGLIALTPLLVFLVRRLVESDLDLDPNHHPGQVLHTGVTLLLLSLVTLVWVRDEFTIPALRALELAIFGSLAAFFAWRQLQIYNLDVLHAAILPGGRVDVPRLVVSATAVRWFFLMVTDGVLIPNTWRRCALV